MVEHLEHLVTKASSAPGVGRRRLYEELLRSEVFVLALGSDAQEGRPEPSAEGGGGGKGSFFLWADGDKAGCVWVMIFPAKDRLQDYAARRGLVAPRGRQFFGVSQKSAPLFSALGRMQSLGGVKIYLEEGCCVSIPSSAVRALSAGRIPGDGDAEALPS